MASTANVVLFAFWGRRANVELQLPFIDRILTEHPNVQFHGWNMARERTDDHYLRTLPEARHDRYNPQAWRHLGRIWSYYTAPRFKDHLFVKMDDDVLFLQTERFGEFLSAIEEHSDSVLSAKVVNNGACTPLMPDLWQQFLALDIPLLDVHMSNRYAELAHEHLFAHYRELLAEPISHIPTDDWLSINVVGCTWPALCQIAHAIGRRSPRWIAGREWDPRNRIGDEGAANMLPRIIVQGFLAGHLGFGPQYVTDDQADAWRARYADLGKEYLNDDSSDHPVPRPRHRSAAHGQPGAGARSVDVLRPAGDHRRRRP